MILISGYIGDNLYRFLNPGPNSEDYMVFQKGKPRPPLRVKTCTICRKSFQPASGAQKTCGEPSCKAQARAQGLAKRRQKASTMVDVKAEVARVLEGGKLGEVKPYMGATGGGEADPRRGADRLRKSNGILSDQDMPELELDLTPLESYIESMVRRVVREEIRFAVQDEIANRLRPLLER
jgi:hypothetical protein